MRVVLLRFAVPLLAAAALVPPTRDLWRRLHDPAPSPSPGADYLARFAPFHPHLAGVRAVSYAWDPDDFTSFAQAAGDADAARRAQRVTFEIYLAQRALAPTLVRPEPGADWLLVNYRDRARVPGDWSQRGLVLVEDPGHGAVLFRLKGR